MKCDRCEWMMVFEKFYGIDEHFSAWRCIACGEIIECYKQNESLMVSLEGAHEKFLDKVASIQTSRQPYVVKYVVDALMEEDEGEDAVALTDEQKGFLFLLVKTVIDALDQKGVNS